MRSFNYQTQPSVIRTLKEPPRPKKVNWERISFLSLVIFCCLLIARHTYRSIATIKVNGQVYLENLEVQFTNHVRIIDIKVKEGDSIRKNEVMFRYVNEDFDETGNDLSLGLQSADDFDWYAKERLNLLKQIEIKEIELGQTRLQLDYQKKELARNEKLVLLDVYQNHSLDPIRENIIKCEIKIAQINKEIEYLNKHIKLLQNKEYVSNNLALGLGAGGESISEQTYLAPIDGIIGEIQVNPNEVCYETENVMTIHQTDSIHIKAYLNPSVIHKMYPGKLVKIKFPDGTKSMGVVDNYFISTYALPAEFQKKYEPTQRSIVVDIRPCSNADKQTWKSFYKMNVKISFPRYWQLQKKEKFTDYSVNDTIRRRTAAPQ